MHSAAQVTPPGTLLIVARSQGDYVAYAEIHGPDPASFPDAGPDRRVTLAGQTPEISS